MIRYPPPPHFERLRVNDEGLPPHFYYIIGSRYMYPELAAAAAAGGCLGGERAAAATVPTWQASQGSDPSRRPHLKEAARAELLRPLVF